MHVARSTDNPDGSYYGQGEHNINVQPTAHPSWPWGYPATDTATATYYGEQYQYQQGQQQGNSDQTQARGNAYDHAANFGSGGNARLHDGTSNNQNGSNESQLFPQSVSAQFLPPVGSGGNVNAVNSVHLPSLDEEQRTTLLGILGTAVVKASSHSHSDGGGDDDDAPHDNNGDSNADGNDEEGGDESDISPIRISCKSKFDPHT
uniref:Uncharacterized protein n=1 Tax=Minutocellus polymorphus TaxID=265543 RepID=A0A7S0FQE5_9STRA